MSEKDIAWWRAQRTNTDRELWRERDADSIHVTARGTIGINVGGEVIEMSLKDWHAAGEEYLFRRQYPAG
jgi:hypothetical protein